MKKKIKAKDIDNNLRDVFEDLDLTQSEAAEKIGIDQGYLSKIKNCQIKPSIDVCRKIAAGLGVTLDIIWPIKKGKQKMAKEVI